MIKKKINGIFIIIFLFIIGFFINSCNNPTSNTSSNSSSSNSSKTKITLSFSNDGGVYDNYVTLTITSSIQDAIIKYTIDNSEPSKNNGFNYENEINIYKSLTLKVFAYKDGYEDSDIYVKSFDINKVAPPKILPEETYHNNNVEVSISCDISDANIRYTLDGSEPSESNGDLYTGPFIINNTKTVKAIAYKSGMVSSNIVSKTFYLNTVEDPSFSIIPGTYNNPIYITISCNTSGATIRYTTDGTDPTPTYGIIYNGESIAINSNLTIKAIAYKEGMVDSQLVVGNYIIKAGTPAISIPSGTYDNGITVSLTTNTSGATIRYTTDGTDPTPTYGTVYSTPINVNTSITLKAIAYKAGIENSDIAQANYVIKVADPIFSPSPGTYNTNQSVTISTSTAGATIRYTTDGTDPTPTYGTIYSSAINVTANTLIKAIAYKTGIANSNVVSGQFNIRVATPTINPASGTYNTQQNITISTTTPGANIRYTLDGTNPSQTNGIIYTGSFVVSENKVVKAIAYKSGMADSTIAIKTYYIRAATPTFSVPTGTYYNDQNVTISTTTTGASIYYTLDGSDPTPTNGTLYTGPVLINKSATLKAVAYKDNMELSPVASATYTLVVSTPTVSPAFGNLASPTLVTISCSTNAAVIKYTLDGSIPSMTNGLFYTGPILIDKTTTLKVFAYKNGWTPSNVLAGRYYFWKNEVADNNYGTGQYTVLKKDSNGDIHIVYYDEINRKLKYSTNKTGVWQTITIDNNSDTGLFNSVYIDSNNNIHVSYYDNTNHDLKYANNVSGTFQNYTLLSDGNIGKYSDIIVDNNNFVHIVCYDETNEKLVYLTNKSGSFESYYIDNETSNGKYSNIEIDKNGVIHILYYDYSYGAIKHAYKVSTSWNIEIIQYTSDPITNISFVIDNSNFLHISYYESLNKDLIYLTNKTGSYVATTIINTNDIGLYSSIAVDQNGYVFISYYYFTGGDLYFSTNVTGSFVNTALQTTNNVGLYTSIDIDSYGRVYISYYDATNKKLFIQYNK